MSNQNSMSRQIVVGVIVAVIAGVILAAFGISGGFDGGNDNGGSGSQPSAPQLATQCDTPQGSCPINLTARGPVGDPCFCVIDGFQVPGTAS